MPASDTAAIARYARIGGAKTMMAFRMTDITRTQGGATDADRLVSISEELAKMAERLFVDSPNASSATEAGEDNSAPLNQHDRLLSLARGIYDSRRLRARVFSAALLFGEPAWDFLLDLFIAELEGKPLSVTAACIGAAVPTSTGLRWLAILEDQGLIRRENDPRDARRVFLHLTEDGFERMTSYLLQFHAPARATTRATPVQLRAVP